MADDPSQQPNISRLRINLDDDEAVSRWAERLGISPEQLRQAARSIPPTVRDIQQYLGLDQWAENLRQDFAVSGLPQITTTPATADVVRRALSPPAPLGGTATRGTDWTYDLHVFGTKPKVLPLEQFGELAKRLADLLGSREHVRFAGLRSGSARLLVKVDDQAQQDVQVQLMRMQQGTVASHSAKAANVDSYLASIGLHAELRDRAGAVVLNSRGQLKEFRKRKLEPSSRSIP